MKNKKAILLTIMLFLPIFVIANYEILASSQSPDGEDAKLKMVDVGTPAPDFNITDVDSLIEYKLSDFLGKVVMIDLFATWCGPCIAALPLIHDLYLMYPETMFQIISIDVDTDETENQVSSFRASYNMDWIVGLDYNRTITDDLNYGSGFIPTMYLIDQSGDVIYAEIGYDDTAVKAALSTVLSDDTTDPVYNEYNFYNNTELSIFNPRFEIFANISEDRNLKSIELRIVNEGIEKFYLEIEKIGDFVIIDQGFSVESLFLYPFAVLELQILVVDYFDNYNLTDVFYLPVTQYTDAGPPTVTNTGVEWYETSDTKYNVTVYATIEEDLLFAKKDVWFMEGATIWKAATFEDFNGTHMVASAIILYSQVNPWELTAHIVVRDAAGNEVLVDLDVADPPITPTPTPTETEEPTEEGSYAFIIPLVSIVAIISIVRIIRKRK